MLLVLIILLGAAVLLVLGPMFLFLGAVAFNSTIGEPEARADVVSLAGGAGDVPASLRIVKAVRDDGFGDTSEGYKLWVDPSEIDAFKRNVRREMERNCAGPRHRSGHAGFAAAVRWRWWRPRDLPDAELFHDQYHWLVFSRRTGTVYVLRH